MKILKKYLVFLLSLGVIGLSFLWDKQTAVKAVVTVGKSFKEMLFILPPIFVLLGLLDVWVPRETMVKYMGKDSGLMGSLLAFLLGSAAAGPLYVVFPIAAAFLRKGVGLFNVLIMIGAWSTTKIPMLLMEYNSLGAKFTLTRLFMNIPLIIIIALVMVLLLKEEDVQEIYKRAAKME
ncbi:MAG: permease [Tissierellia bacterium]|nr:permease [Tissierellia bacterium]